MNQQCTPVSVSAVVGWGSRARKWHGSAAALHASSKASALLARRCPIRCPLPKSHRPACHTSRIETLSLMHQLLPCVTSPFKRKKHFFGATSEQFNEWSYREALTEAGRRLASSMPRRSGPPCPALPTALLGRPIAVSLDTKSSWTGLGMRGKIVSK